MILLALICKRNVAVKSLSFHRNIQHALLIFYDVKAVRHFSNTKDLITFRLVDELCLCVVPYNKQTPLLVILLIVEGRICIKWNSIDWSKVYFILYRLLFIFSESVPYVH